MTDSDEVEPGEILKSTHLSQQALSEIWRLRTTGTGSLEDPRDAIERQTMHEIDIQNTVKEFRICLEKLGISQRFAAKYIMDQSSQGNLSFLLDKGRHKLWSEMSPRGRLPYVRMRQWLDSLQQQKETLELLEKTKASKRSGPRDAWGKREKFSLFQVTVLCRMFEEDPNPSLGARTILAEKLQIPLEKITVWFQNQRARGFPARKILTQTNPSKNYYDPNKDQRFIQSLKQKFSDANSRAEITQSSPEDLSLKPKLASKVQSQSSVTNNVTAQGLSLSYNQMMLCNAAGSYEDIRRAMLDRFLNTQYMTVKRQAELQMNDIPKRPRTLSYGESEMDEEEISDIYKCEKLDDTGKHKYFEHSQNNVADDKADEAKHEPSDLSTCATTGKTCFYQESTHYPVNQTKTGNDVRHITNGLRFHSDESEKLT